MWSKARRKLKLMSSLSINLRVPTGACNVDQSQKHQGLTVIQCLDSVSTPRTRDEDALCDPLFKLGSSLCFRQCSVCQCRHIQRNLTVQCSAHLPVWSFSFHSHLDDTSAMLYSKSGSIMITIISHLSVTVITALVGLIEAGINCFPAW